MVRPFLLKFLICAPLLLLAASGCGHKPEPPKSETPTVTVSTPLNEPFTDSVEFTGRTEAVFQTEIRPRVTGYLVGMPFKEGALVKTDDVLFEIDDRPYKAALDQAKGEVERSQAALVKAQANLDIGLKIQKENPAAISVQEIVLRTGARDEATGSLAVSKANEATAKLNFDWCKVRSPIDGHVNKYNFTLGNLVNANQSLLTTVVSEEPMYVYFDVDENTLLRVKRKLILPSKENKLEIKGAIPVEMGLEDEKGFPHKGDLNFVANAVNPSTGTIPVRGVFDNPASVSGKRLMSPGMFVRVRVPLGEPRDALMVSETALGSDQGQKYLWVVVKNPEGKEVVGYRRVTTGPLQPNGLRVIEKGLQKGDRVIVSGIQMVHSDMEVKVDEKPMPVQPVKGQESGSKTAEPEKK
jgi:multidrug efflux system membrane fusion protein